MYPRKQYVALCCNLLQAIRLSHPSLLTSLIFMISWNSSSVMLQGKHITMLQQHNRVGSLVDCVKIDKNNVVCHIYSREDSRYNYVPDLRGWRQHRACVWTILLFAMGELALPGLKKEIHGSSMKRQCSQCS